MAVVSRNFITDLSNAVLYDDGCDPNSNYPIKGRNNEWTVLEIMKKFLSIIDINHNAEGFSNEDIYRSVCAKLKSKLGSGVPYSYEAECSRRSSATTIMADIKKMITIANKQLENRMEAAIRNAENDNSLSVDSIGDIFYKENYSKRKFTEFILIQVIKQGFCLEVVPTLIKFKGMAQASRVLWFSTGESSAKMECSKVRFTLNRNHVMQIMNKLDDEQENVTDLFS